MSVVAIIGGCRFDGSCASGTAFAAAPFFGFHWFAPAGLLVSSHSWPNNVSKKLLSHFVGVGVHAPSRPLVMVWPAMPLSNALAQPRPWCASSAPSGASPTCFVSPAPGALPQ